MSHRIPSNRLDRSPDCRNRQCNCTVANIVSQHSGIHLIHPAGELIRGEVGETLRRVGLSHVLCRSGHLGDSSHPEPWVMKLAQA